MQDHLAAAGAGDVSGDIAQQRRPAKHAAHRRKRRRMLRQILEDRVAAEDVPHALVGIVGSVIQAEFLFAPSRAILGGRAIERRPGPFEPVPLQHARDHADAVFPDMPETLFSVAGMRQ